MPSARCPALEGTGGTSDPRVLDRSSPNAGYGLAAPALPKKLYSRRTALPCGQGLRTSLLPKDQEFPPLRGRREQLGACSPFPQQEPKQPLSRAARYTLTLRMAARPTPPLSPGAGQPLSAATRPLGAAGKTAIFLPSNTLPALEQGAEATPTATSSPHPHRAQKTDVVRPSRVTRRHPLPG